MGNERESDPDDDSKLKVFLKNYFVADRGTVTEPIESAKKDLPSFLTETAESFAKNITTTVLTASLPFKMVFVSIRKRRFMQIHIAERIRTPGVEGSNDSSLIAERTALESAGRRFHEESEDPKKILTQATQVTDELVSLLDDPFIKEASAELLRQAEVQIWGAFEVLSQDAVVAALNKHPAMIEKVVSNFETRKMLPGKGVPYDVISDLGYNLEQKMGSLLARLIRLDDVHTIRKVYRSLLPDANELRVALEDDRLWHLNQRRHVIVHSRGVVTREYVENTGSTIPIGTPLFIDPGELEVDISFIVNVGVQLLRALASLPADPIGSPRQ